MPEGCCVARPGLPETRAARVPSHVAIERHDGARQARPLEAVEHWRGQARKVDLDDLLVAEELVEAAAEMAARLDDDRVRLGDVETEHLEEDRVGALRAQR